MVDYCAQFILLASDVGFVTISAPKRMSMLYLASLTVDSTALAIGSDSVMHSLHPSYDPLHKGQACYQRIRTFHRELHLP